MKHTPVCLAADAERVLTDIVLKRLIAYEHILGPYRHARPIVRGLFRRIFL